MLEWVPEVEGIRGVRLQPWTGACPNPIYLPTVPCALTSGIDGMTSTAKFEGHYRCRKCYIPCSFLTSDGPHSMKPAGLVTFNSPCHSFSSIVYFLIIFILLFINSVYASMPNPVSNPTMPIQELPVKVHEVDYLAISWCHIFILVGRLFYLKVLHGLSFICKHTSYEYGIDRAIERSEQRILHIFFANIPETYYRLVEELGPLPPITYPVVIPSGGCGPRPGSSIRVLHSTRSSRPSSNAALPQQPEVPLAVAVPNRFADYNRETMYAPANLSPAVRLEPFLKGRSIERSMEASSPDENENNLSPVPANGSAYATPSDSVYSSILRRTVSGEKSRPTSQSHSTAMHTAGMATASEYAQMLERPQFSDPDRRSPSSDSQMLAAMVAARPREEQDEFEGPNAQRSRSMESFPGRFPISDGLEYTVLATVYGRVNGRNAASVRPFSEL